MALPAWRAAVKPTDRYNFRAPQTQWAQSLRRILKVTPECLPKPAQALVTSARVWDDFLYLAFGRLGEF